MEGSAAAPLIDELQSDLATALKGAGVDDNTANLIASLAGGATAATIGGATGGSMGAVTAFNADVNNRQLHPTERALAKQLAAMSGGKYTVEQIEDAMRNATNKDTGESVVAGMVVNPDNPNAIYDKGAVWELGEGGHLVQVLPPQPDPELTAFITQNSGQTYEWHKPSAEPAGHHTGPRDPLTNRPLEAQGRYSQVVVIDGKVYEPKYHPCATTACQQNGSNLDMSDPATRAYVQALDQQVFKDISKGATVGSLVTPVGAPGAVLFAVGLLGSVGQVAMSNTPLDTARDEGIKSVSELGATKFFERVLGHTPSAAARATALINLSGGWDAFTERVKVDVLGIKPNAPKN